MALELVNELGKVTGDIIGITRTTDVTRDRCCLIYNGKVWLAEDTRSMFGLSKRIAAQHKEMGENRLKWDEVDTCHLVEQLVTCKFKVSEHVGSKLVSISTKDIAPPKVTNVFASCRRIWQKNADKFY